MPRILHTADWQIGRAYGGFELDDAVPLAEARLAAVERIAALAAAERVDAVLVAGDVFDAQTVSARSIRRLFHALAAYDGPWVMIPGNHDAALADGVWSHALRLAVVPPNVRLALTPGVLALPQAGLALLCAPLTQRHTYGDLTGPFDTLETPEGLVRIGIAHGAVQGVLPADIDAPNPIAPDRAARARLDYLALGDWHGTKCIDPRTWYAGTPEPDRFKANDAGQVLLVEIDAPGALPRIEPRRIAQFRWQQWSRTLSVPSDLDALVAQLAAVGPQDVLELVVDGELALADHERLQQAIGQAHSRARCLRPVLDGLRLAPTDEDIARLDARGLLGELIAELRDAPPDEARRAQDALAILTGLLAGRDTTAKAAA